MSSEKVRALALTLLTGGAGDPRRGELQQRILGRRTREGAGVGIAGAEVCQACGTIESFQGLAAAMLKHRNGDYLCSGCLAELSAKTTPGHSSTELSRIEEAMAKQRHRFCEVCRTQVLPDGAQRVGHHARVCAECHRALAGLGPEIEALLRDLSKLRYLELRHSTLSELSEYDRFNDWQRAELDRL